MRNIWVEFTPRYFLFFMPLSEKGKFKIGGELVSGSSGRAPTQQV
jgi:hypothetical protein